MSRRPHLTLALFRGSTGPSEVTHDHGPPTEPRGRYGIDLQRRRRRRRGASRQLRVVRGRVQPGRGGDRTGTDEGHHGGPCPRGRGDGSARGELARSRPVAGGGRRPRPGPGAVIDLGADFRSVSEPDSRAPRPTTERRRRPPRRLLPTEVTDGSGTADVPGSSAASSTTTTTTTPPGWTPGVAPQGVECT